MGFEIESTALNGDQSENDRIHSEKMYWEIECRGTRTPDVELGCKPHQLYALLQNPRQLVVTYGEKWPNNRKLIDICPKLLQVFSGGPQVIFCENKLISISKKNYAWVILNLIRSENSLIEMFSVTVWDSVLISIRYPSKIFQDIFGETAYFFWRQVIRKLLMIYFWLFWTPSTSFYYMFCEKSILKNMIFSSIKVEKSGIIFEYIGISFSRSWVYFLTFRNTSSRRLKLQLFLKYLLPLAET